MILFLDTETTGLPKNYKAPCTDVDNWPRILQLAWLLKTESNEPFLGECDMIKPDGWVVPDEPFWNDNNLTMARAENEGLPIREALKKLSDALAKAHTIVCHNIDFDVPILQAELIRAGIPHELNVEQICTMKTSTDICQIPGPYGFKWPKLEELWSWLWPDIAPLEGAHDAGQDCWHTAECYFELKKRGLLPIKQSGDITYSNIKRYDGMPAEQYFRLGGISHSFLKREKAGVVEKFSPSPKMLLGSMVDKILTEPSNVNVKDPLFPIAKKISVTIKNTFGDLIERFVPQVSYTAEAHYAGLTITTTGRLDWLLPKHAVIDLKFTTAKKLEPVVDFFGYRNQVWNYAKMAEVPKAYILAYSEPLGECLPIFPVDVSSNYNEFWAKGILKHGSIR